ncbi:hypothetical protein L7F22_046960 [Adiantum nelumboides]|nr:hypothetical protein [Adiantum nelumboides]
MWDRQMECEALLDSGTTACFMDKDFARKQGILVVEKSSPITIEVIDGRPLASRDVRYETRPTKVTLKNQCPSDPIVINLPWLEFHAAHPSIKWRSRRVEPRQVQKKERKQTKPIYIGAKLLAIIDSFKIWCHVEGAPHKITVYTDHKNLKYFMSSRVLNQRQARWSGILPRFDFIISYRPGRQQGKPDPLSRRPYLARRQLQGQGSVNEDFQETHGLIYYKGLLYIPPCPIGLEILPKKHDLLIAGHFEINKTIELISRDFWCPQMWKLVKEYVGPVTLATDPRPLGIALMDCFIPCQFQARHGHPYQWISSWSYPCHKHLTPF